MAGKELQLILGQLRKGEISVAKAAQMLSTVGPRKLRGVKATKLEMQSYHEFVRNGNFRAFANELGLDTTGAQGALGRLTRAVYEKQPE